MTVKVTCNCLYLGFICGHYLPVSRTSVYCSVQDVAARGLDLRCVHWIVQYNTPGRPVDYIHRVGRTARIGITGNALLFVTPAEVDYIKVLGQHHIELESFVHRVLMFHHTPPSD